MNFDLSSLLADDDAVRLPAVAAAREAPEHARSALATRLAFITREAARGLGAATQTARIGAVLEPRLMRGVFALSLLRVESAKACLVGIADEESAPVKNVLARALTGTETNDGRALLVYLLSDDEVRAEAIRAISVRPWPGIVRSLIEVAEGDDDAARLAAATVASCGATFPEETYAAADFLLELLDDDGAFEAAVDAILRHGRGFPGIAERAKRLAKEPGLRKPAGLCLLAFCTDIESSALLELALSGEKADADVAQTFLGGLLHDRDAAIRDAAQRAWKALDLR